MANSRAFEAACGELERCGGTDRWAARGAVQLALMDAGLEKASVTPAQMKVVVERVLPKQLQSMTVSDISTVCEKIKGALSLLGDEGKTETADQVFQRIAS
jgi:hypothetical protein